MLTVNRVFHFVAVFMLLFPLFHFIRYSLANQPVWRVPSWQILAAGECGICDWRLPAVTTPSRL